MEIWLDSLWVVNKQTYFIVYMKLLICYIIIGICFQTALFVRFVIVRTETALQEPKTLNKHKNVTLAHFLFSSCIDLKLA